MLLTWKYFVVHFNKDVFPDDISNYLALSINTGKFTGRSPKDRFIVKDDITEKVVWWGDINIPFNSNNFDQLYKKSIDYLQNKEIYVRDVYACSLKPYQLNIRVINEYPWSNHFVSNMFNEPKDEELKSFIHKGFWQPMDTLRDKVHLEELWDSGKAPWKTWE